MSTKKCVQVRLNRSNIPYFSDLTPAAGVEQRIVRGRMTQEDAIVDLELAGDFDAINSTILGFGIVGDVVRIWDPPFEGGVPVLARG